MVSYQYIGRYAPSPTGRLHLGNLRTALLAWLFARLHQGRFLLRIDDLDSQRVIPGCDTQIFRDLEWLGIDWDGKVCYQSNRLERYQAAFDNLRTQSLIYPCFCSRKDIQQIASAPHGQSRVYPGTCRGLNAKQLAEKMNIKAPAWRFSVGGFTESIKFNDGVLGCVSEQLSYDCGDFVVKRADKLFAYQLAVVVDDADQAITDVVRGEDLLPSTVRQIAVFDSLYQRSPPNYWHLPLMLDTKGEKMSKRDGSESIEQWQSNEPERLIGHLAYSLQLTDLPSPIALNELLANLTKNQLVKKMKLNSNSLIRGITR